LKPEDQREKTGGQLILFGVSDYLVHKGDSRGTKIFSGMVKTNKENIEVDNNK
jgi:hypothetical protein